MDTVVLAISGAGHFVDGREDVCNTDEGLDLKVGLFLSNFVSFD